MKTLNMQIQIQISDNADPETVVKNVQHSLACLTSAEYAPEIGIANPHVDVNYTVKS